MSDIDLSICYCGWGYNRPMIRCCHCRRWYHYDCVNLTCSDLDDAERYYCFACMDFKPNSDREEEYDFYEDKRMRQEMNRETRKRVHMVLSDDQFSNSNVLSMDLKSVQHMICCIEQQLLLEDTSPSLYDEALNTNTRPKQELSIDLAFRKRLLDENIFLKFLILQVTRENKFNQLINLHAYQLKRENNEKNGLITTCCEKEWMKASRLLLEHKDLPPLSIGINTDIRTFNWRSFSVVQKELTGRMFDVVMMDPPWQLTTSDPSRGVALAYPLLDDESILHLPIHFFQESGLLFIWAINAKFVTAMKMIQHWGYTLKGDISWIKLSKRGYLLQGNGYYLQHAKETCFVAMKGDVSRIDPVKLNQISDVILAQRKGQSQKPDEIYSIIEELVPNGYYLEIFGRKNNLRDNWVTIGNEI